MEWLNLIRQREEADKMDRTFNEISLAATIAGASSQESQLESTIIPISLRFFHLDKLVTFLKSEFIPLRQKMEKFKIAGEIDFSHLWGLFHKGVVISFKDSESDAMMAGVITSTSYANHVSQSELDCFEISARYVSHNGHDFFYVIRKLYPLRSN
jgi:hypothetical protein